VAKCVASTPVKNPLKEGDVNSNIVSETESYLDGRVTRILFQELTDIYRMILGFTDIVPCFRGVWNNLICLVFGLGHLLANATYVSLTPFDSSKLLDKSLPASA
jgi:hypothetical protein